MKHMFQAGPFTFLKELRHCREIELGRAATYLPHRFGDHRDVYWIATLIKNGFVGIWLTHNESPWDEQNEQELTLNLYMSGFIGTGKKYLDRTLSGADFKKDVKLFCTAKTDLYFEELREKQIERWFAAFLAVTAALLSAWATAAFTT